MKTPRIVAQGLLLIPSDEQMNKTHCDFCGDELDGAILSADGSAACFKAECQ